MKRTLMIMLAVLLLVSCATAPKYSSFVSIKGTDCPQAQFAAGDIAAALEKGGTGISDVDPSWTIRFADIDPSLGEQAYRIEVLGRIIEITGGDERGLMYGGLEVAEQIDLYGIDGIRSTEAAPWIEERGVKLNLTIDMRTPTYSGAGDSEQLNIETMWDMGFWHDYIDELARNRYNTLSLWSLNPFASMVKVPEYPDIALDDVWRTTLEFDDSYNGTATNLVRPEHWENYEVVKKMTIDQKIAFWQEVMQYAADRGIKTYIITWNIYTYGEQGKYGIDSDVNNQVTKDYFRASVRQMMRTYPLLAGIGVTAGENMVWDPGMDIINETWLWETYGLGIQDVLEEQPDRQFKLIHRLHLAEFDLIYDTWKDFKGELEICENYINAHMYATTTAKDGESVLSQMNRGGKLNLLLRDDDFYNYRFGDVDFVREYIENFPDHERINVLIGSDGFIQARDFTNTDTQACGDLVIERQWFTYGLWGKMLYNPELGNDYFLALLNAHFHADCTALLDAMAAAGKVIPQIDKQYYVNGDATWYPEASWSSPATFGYLNIQRWMRSTNTYPYGHTMSIADYAVAASKGEVVTDLMTPPEVSANLKSLSMAALASVAEAESVDMSAMSDLQKREYLQFVSDQKAMANLGLYYSEKILAAVDMRILNETSDESYRQSAIAHLTTALDYWKAYAEIQSIKYKPQRLCRQGYVDLNEITKSVENDISLAEKWRIKKL